MLLNDSRLLGPCILAVLREQLKLLLGEPPMVLFLAFGFRFFLPDSPGEGSDFIMGRRGNLIGHKCLRFTQDIAWSRERGCHHSCHPPRGFVSADENRKLTTVRRVLGDISRPTAMNELPETPHVPLDLAVRVGCKLR